MIGSMARLTPFATSCFRKERCLAWSRHIKRRDISSSWAACMAASSFIGEFDFFQSCKHRSDIAGATGIATALVDRSRDRFDGRCLEKIAKRKLMAEIPLDAVGHLDSDE